MTCPLDIYELLSAERDGELRDTERRSLAEHLRDCESCRQARRDLESQDALFQAVLPSRSAVDIAALRAGLAHPRRSPLGPRIAAGGLAAGAIFALSLVLGLQSSEATDAARALLPRAWFKPLTQTKTGIASQPAPSGREAPVLVISQGQGDHSRLILWSSSSGKIIPLTMPPPGHHDRRAILRPDGKKLAYVRETTSGRGVLRIIDLDTMTDQALLPTKAPKETKAFYWALRFVGNKRLRFISDARPPSSRSYRSAREREITLGDRRLRNLAPHLWRVPSTASADGCVVVRTIAAPNASGHRIVTFVARSCHDTPHRLTATWPLALGNNVHSVVLSPDGRFLAVTMDRDPVAQRPSPDRPRLLYLVKLWSQTDLGPFSVPQEDPGMMRMPSLTPSLRWVRLATQVVGRPEFSRDSKTLCFMRREGSTRQAWCWSGREETAKKVGPQNATLRFATPSPEGHWVALGTRATSGLASLILVDRDTKQVRPLPTLPLAPGDRVLFRTR
ncbi:MAG: zf-HC2 domain-containing protein [Deltaproteobacteria bacterium]|nr:zf-HC2 domain-containing protein [Deltaproteobacteria bacterium]